ncbi:MAG: ribonuclease HII [Syntrophales bacterium]|nr:ribonuclease HII [Syntrophales bacterium]
MKAFAGSKRLHLMNSFERNAYQSGYRLIAGVDEAGRGPLAGPVVAAAVIFPPDYHNSEIRDSNLLSPQKRERLHDVIREDAVTVGLGVVDAVVIDEINILKATLMAMQEALLELSPAPDFLLIDGITPLSLSMPQRTLIKGDSRSVSVAAASIIAKVSRDRIMEIYHRQFPQYNFIKNKGYGTEEHRAAIRRYGPCKIHRRSFNMYGTPAITESYDLFTAY